MAIIINTELEIDYFRTLWNKMSTQNKYSAKNKSKKGLDSKKKTFKKNSTESSENVHLTFGMFYKIKFGG